MKKTFITLMAFTSLVLGAQSAFAGTWKLTEESSEDTCRIRNTAPLCGSTSGSCTTGSVCEKWTQRGGASSEGAWCPYYDVQRYECVSTVQTGDCLVQGSYSNSGGDCNIGVSPVCGEAKNTCTSGSYKGLSDSTNYYRWQCYTGSSSVTCTAPKTSTPPPENGSCGSSKNSCSKVAFRDRSDTTTQYRWYCDGSNGGSTAACSMAKPVATATPVNGVCTANVKGSCDAGTSANELNAGTKWTWECRGLNGGSTANCSVGKVWGSCGSSADTCNAGSYHDVADTSTEYKWECGADDASDPYRARSCSKTKETYTHYTTGSWSACSGSGSWTWNSSTGEGTRSGTQTRTVTSYTNTTGPDDSEPSSSRSCTETTTDTVSPTCSIYSPTNLATNWYNSSVAVIARCNDSGGSGCVSTYTSSITVSNNGNKASFTVYDNAGNSGTCESDAVQIDKTDPTVNISGNNSDLAGATWTVSRSDALSGIASTDISVSPSSGSSVSGTTVTITGTGSYTITATVEDNAGNTATANKTVMVYPNQMNASNSTISTNCNNGNWDADGSDTCTVTVILRDQYGNALDSKPFQISGVSDTPLDAVHNTTPSSNAEEAIVFASGGNGIQDALTSTTDSSGTQTLNLQAYAPGSGEIDFTVEAQTHTAANYPGSGSYNRSDTEAESYQAARMYDFSWDTVPTSFQKNAAKNVTVTISNNVTSATDERLGLYVYTGTSGGDYAVSSTSDTESTSAWVDSDGASNLGANYSNDGAVIYSDSDLADGASYSYAIEFVKQAGEILSQTSVDIIPFVRMTIGGKDVAYVVSPSESSILYNQAVGVQTGTNDNTLTQSGGSGVQSDANDEASDSSVGSVSLVTIQADLKEAVRKESLNLDENTVAGTLTSLSSFSNVHNINNGRSYIVKGDDLIITGTNGILEIGEEPVAFISHGGNVQIQANIQYAGSNTVNPTIAIIAVRDETTGKGGEIQIHDQAANGDPLSSIIGSYFAERGLVSTDGTTTDFDPDDRVTIFTDEITITGSVFGGNTLGGADNDPVSCPSFVKASDCNDNMAQKYDLNYLRMAETTTPVVIDYYVNKEYLPKEMQ